MAAAVASRAKAPARPAGMVGPGPNGAFASTTPKERGETSCPGSAGRLPRRSDAELAAMREKGQRALAARRAACTLRRGFLDSEEWERLAAAFGVRLPQWHEAPEPGKMERWLRRLGVSPAAYRENSGDATLADFARLNPDWPLRAWVGLLLEAIDAGHVKPRRPAERSPGDASPA